jgi:Gram-negative bacterial TonB protein C-terminal
MRKLSGNQMLAALLTGLAVLWAWPTRASGPQFVPPRIATASDIPYPVNTATPGIVTLLLKLDATARVENVQALRDIPPLTSTAQTAVQTWTFTPATRDGSPVPSTLSVNVVFNPFNPGGV